MGDGFLYISSGHKRRWRQASRDFIIFFSIPLAATLLGLHIVPPTEQVKRGTVWPSWLAVLCVFYRKHERWRWEGWRDPPFSLFLAALHLIVTLTAKNVMRGQCNHRNYACVSVTLKRMMWWGEAIDAHLHSICKKEGYRRTVHPLPLSCRFLIILGYLEPHAFLSTGVYISLVFEKIN